MSGVLRGFPSATYFVYASTKTFVRPCSSKKLLIYELETYLVLIVLQGIYGWALVEWLDRKRLNGLNQPNRLNGRCMTI